MSYGTAECKVCKKPFQKRCSNHKVCDVCSPEYRRMDNVNRLRRYRDERGSKKIGDTIQCSNCGIDTIFRAANQHRCRECQHKYNVQQTNKWLSANEARNGEYKRRAKENYYYSGNRIPSLERNGFKCIKCGATDNLHTHHIDGNGKGTKKPGRNDSLDNLITLCGKHHKMLHTRTQKLMYKLHPDTVQQALEEFLHSHWPPQA